MVEKSEKKISDFKLYTYDFIGGVLVVLGIAWLIMGIFFKPIIILLAIITIFVGSYLRFKFKLRTKYKH